MKKELIMMAMALSIGSVNAQKTKTYTTAERLYFEGKEMYDLKQYTMIYISFDLADAESSLFDISLR